jgi:hypothetical protein
MPDVRFACAAAIPEPIGPRSSGASPAPNRLSRRRSGPNACRYTRHTLEHPTQAVIVLSHPCSTARRHARTTGTADSSDLAFPGAPSASTFRGHRQQPRFLRSAIRHRGLVNAGDLEMPIVSVSAVSASTSPREASNETTPKPPRARWRFRAFSTPVSNSTANLTPACSGLATLAADARR